ncbi:MAG TPA: hypothetical protein PLH30_00350 [Bacteroidales bacterium]|nr:hypothetical protein [Bacteroidales bacterium]
MMPATALVLLANGFETYVLTGVALIWFIVLEVTIVEFQSTFIVWIFMMRFKKEQPLLFTSI